MTWAEWHGKSEVIASEAHAALRSDDTARAAALFRDAADLEARALADLDPEKVRTIGITTVSAVSLWFKAGDLLSAQQLAHAALAQKHLPTFAIVQLRQLLQSIWNSEAMAAAGVTFLPGQVLVSVRGGEVVVGGAPLDLIIAKVQTVQSLFYRVIEYAKGIPLRKGPPPASIQEACAPWLFQAPAGSYQFAVAIQRPKQMSFFDDSRIEPDKVAQQFMTILRASSEDPANALPALVPEKDYRDTFLKLTRNLAPTAAGKTFSEIEVKAHGETRGIIMATGTRKALNDALRPAISTDPTTENVEVTLHGVLRAVHLDKDWLQLHDDSGATQQINGLNDAADDVIGPMVNKRVSVIAVKGAKGYTFRDIELDD